MRLAFHNTYYIIALQLFVTPSWFFGGDCSAGNGTKYSRIQTRMGIKNMNARESELTSGNGMEWEYWYVRSYAHMSARPSRY